MCRNCEEIVNFFDDKGRGFCSGIRKKPLKSVPEDVICLCFIDLKDGIKHNLKPSEALVISAALVGAYEVWAKRNGVTLKN